MKVKFYNGVTIVMRKRNFNLGFGVEFAISSLSKFIFFKFMIVEILLND
jgi:hypothetical protein